MHSKEDLGKAIASANKLKGISQREAADHFGIKSPSFTNWIQTGRVAKSRLPSIFEYYSDVVGPEHWGLTDASPLWPKTPTRKIDPSVKKTFIETTDDFDDEDFSELIEFAKVIRNRKRKLDGQK